MMGDQLYGGDMIYMLDGIKQEPGMQQILGDSPGMPIPSRGRPLPSGRTLNDFNLDLDEALALGALPNMSAGGMFNIGQMTQNGMMMSNDQQGSFSLQNALGPSVWVSLCDTFKMDEDDDILQVDESDLIQGPTLAELNANDDTLLEDLSFDDLLLPEDGGFQAAPVQMQPASSFPPSSASSVPSFLRESSSNSGLSCSVPASQGLFIGIPSPPGQLGSPQSPRPGSSGSNITPTSSSRHSTLHELLMRRNEPAELSPGSFTLLSAAAGPSSSSASRLSSSAPTHLGLEQIWQRREPRQHLLSTGSLVEAGSTSSLSTGVPAGGVLSPASHHELSHDEGFDSEDDSDHYDDFSSDGESSDGEGGRSSSRARQKKDRYFWQYNVQAKGPKGQRLVLKTKQEDPHVLNEVTDPVFSPSCAVRGIKHSGKARKGDGNDLTPNPRKLHSIGRELDKLGRVINDMTPVSELPLNIRPKSRKEKNKLASRACRLKKKAQHEANKIKLYGLEMEHKRLISGIQHVKNTLASSYSADQQQTREELARAVEKTRRISLKLEIAGTSTDFVNSILEKVKAGVPGGGLEDVC